MEYREYDLNSYKLHIIKSDKVKKCHMEVHFRDKVSSDNIYYKSMISDIITDCSSLYQNRKEVVIKLEELYNASLYGTVSKAGGVVDTMFVYDFINPKYIKDDNYLFDVLKMPFDMILKPKVINKAFDPKIFDVVKNRSIRDVLSVSENPVKLSVANSLKVMDSDSLSSVSVLGTRELVSNVTASSLYNEYNNMLKNSYCDIFIIGDIDYDEVYDVVVKTFKLKYIKTLKLDMHVQNRCVKRPLVVEDDSSFVQSNLCMVFNLDGLSALERNSIIIMYNYILGSGGLTSKLYKKLREENSLCYGVHSIYNKYDALLVVHVSLDQSNKKKAIKLIKEAVRDMQKGIISEDDILDAKTNLLNSLKMSLDSNMSLLSNYVFMKFDQLPLIEDRMDAIKNISIDDLISVSKKVKLNTIYNLKAGE